MSKIDFSNYKVFKNYKWIYGDLEISFDSEFNKHYYIVNENERIECNADELCKKTIIMDKHKNFVYSNDIIELVIMDDSEELSKKKYVVDNYDGILEFPEFNLYVNGLVLIDMEDNKANMFSDVILKSYESIEIVGSRCN